MTVKHVRYPHRTAEIVAERGGLVVFHAKMNDETFYPFHCRPAAEFWKDYK